ncbi:hypothetical protein D3C71_1644460 [compost metagenome]
MLEEVGVQLLVFHRRVGLDVVAELLDLQIHALGLELGFHKVQDLGVWHGRGGHLQHVGGMGADGQGGKGNCGQGLFQHDRLFR